MTGYFSKFREILYDGNRAKDLSRRVVMIDELQNNPFHFNSQEIKAYDYPDLLSFEYYKDQYYDWIFYVGNNVVDPYFDWYVNNEVFNAEIIKKYGNHENATQKIAYYLTKDDSQEIEPSHYATLSFQTKKYWTPNYDVSGRILNYRKRRLRRKIVTNAIIKYTLETIPTEGWVYDDLFIVNISSTTEGRVQLLKIEGNSMWCQHCYGTYNVDIPNGLVLSADSKIKKRLSVNTYESSFRITNTKILSQMIHSDEYVYWKPIYYYDLEVANNERKKLIRVLKPDYATIMQGNLDNLVK